MFLLPFEKLHFAISITLWLTLQLERETWVLYISIINNDSVHHKHTQQDNTRIINALVRALNSKLQVPPCKHCPTCDSAKGSDIDLIDTHLCSSNVNVIESSVYINLSARDMIYILYQQAYVNMSELNEDLIAGL